jgi:hypothetical protein
VLIWRYLERLADVRSGRGLVWVGLPLLAACSANGERKSKEPEEMAVLQAACAPPALSPLSVTPVPRLDYWVVAGDTVYGSSAYSLDDWFHVFDFSTRSELRELGSWDVEYGGPIAVVGSWALVAASRSGLLSFDVSDPGRLAEPRALELDEGLPFLIRAQGSVALVSTLQYVQLFDVSAPATPLALSRLPLADVSGADWVGSRAYLVSSPVKVPFSVTLHVLDLTDPAAPVTLSTTVTPLSEIAARVVAAGDRVFVQASDKILAYDVSDPVQPRLEASIPTLLRSDALTVRGNVLFASGGDGLSIIDISRIDQPRELASYAGIIDKPVFVEGDRVYALDAQVGGLVTLDLSRACPAR